MMPASIEGESGYDHEFEELLRRHGLFKVHDRFDVLIKAGESMLDDTIKRRPNAPFAYNPSCLSVRHEPSRRQTLLMVVDVGGSHTRVGLTERSPDGEQNWELLVDRHNDYFDCGDERRAIDRFNASLAREMAKEARAKHVPLGKIDGVGFVWSNGIDSKRMTGSGCRGVTATITGVASGRAYRKKEFFTQGLNDGYELGGQILRCLRGVGLSPRAFVIANDTILTLKATPHAIAGMVASTGANVTYVDVDGWIVNTECGGSYLIPDELVAPGDLIPGSSDGKVRVEDLMAGKWLPNVFARHVTLLAKAGCAELAQLGSRIEDGSIRFSGPDLSALLKAGSTVGLKPVYQMLSPRGLNRLIRLCQVVVERAGEIAAAMAYLSVKHHLSFKREAVLSLDSSQARNLAGYSDALQRRLTSLVQNQGNVRIVLQEPWDEVSVPMRGAAEAAAGELPA